MSFLVKQFGEKKAKEMEAHMKESDSLAIDEFEALSQANEEIETHLLKTGLYYGSLGLDKNEGSQFFFFFLIPLKTDEIKHSYLKEKYGEEALIMSALAIEVDILKNKKFEEPVKSTNLDTAKEIKRQITDKPNANVVQLSAKVEEAVAANKTRMYILGVLYGIALSACILTLLSLGFPIPVLLIRNPFTGCRWWLLRHASKALFEALKQNEARPVDQKILRRSIYISIFTLLVMGVLAFFSTFGLALLPILFAAVITTAWMGINIAVLRKLKQGELENPDLDTVERIVEQDHLRRPKRVFHNFLAKDSKDANELVDQYKKINKRLRRKAPLKASSMPLNRVREKYRNKKLTLRESLLFSYIST